MDKESVVMAEKKKEPTSLEKLLKGLRVQHAVDDVGKAYELWDAHQKKSDNFFVDVFEPAQERLYQTVKKEALGKFKFELDTDLKGKNKQVKELLGDALLEWFKYTFPSTAKTMAKLKSEERFDFLATRYDEIHGFDPSSEEGRKLSIRHLAETFVQGGGTVGKLMRDLYQRKADHVEQGIGYVNTQVASSLFAQTRPEEVYEHLNEKVLGKKGLHIPDDKLGRFLQGLDQGIKQEGVQHYISLRDLFVRLDELGRPQVEVLQKRYGIQKKPQKKSGG